MVLYAIASGAGFEPYSASPSALPSFSLRRGRRSRCCRPPRPRGGSGVAVEAAERDAGQGGMRRCQSRVPRKEGRSVGYRFFFRFLFGKNVAVSIRLCIWCVSASESETHRYTRICTPHPVYFPPRYRRRHTLKYTRCPGCAARCSRCSSAALRTSPCARRSTRRCIRRRSRCPACGRATTTFT